MEYEYDSFTKDMLIDLLTIYDTSDELITDAIHLLHEKNFGSISKRTRSEKLLKTFTPASDAAKPKLDELFDFYQKLAEQLEKLLAGNNQAAAIQFSEQINDKLVKKIDELGMKFSKIVPADHSKQNQQKTTTTEMSHEEVLQLIKRIDKLESKLTQAISETRVAVPTGTSSRRREIRDFGDAPKITAIDSSDGPITESVERPLLDDVLDTVIVSVEKDEE